MNDEQPGNDHERWLVEAAIALLAGSRWLTWLSIVFAGVCAFALAATDLQGTLPRLAVSTVLALGAVAAYLALRTTMDRVFFQALRQPPFVPGSRLAAFDEALRTLRWLHVEKAGRGLAERVAGAKKIVRAQGIVLLLQAVLLAVVPWTR